MQSLKGHHKNTPSFIKQNSLVKPSFSASLAKTLNVQGASNLKFGAVSYNQKHNLLIVCPSNQTIQFYDATTLKPLRERQACKIYGGVMSLTFQPETDTYVFGCASGFIYQYNIPKDEIKRLKAYDSPILRVAFLHDNFYAFSMWTSKKVHLGNLENKNVLTFDLKNCHSFCLYHFAKKNLLFTGLNDGKMIIYRTNKLPHLQMVCSVQTGGWVLTTQSININGKEYMITSSKDQNVKIWCLVKGKMRLVRVIPNEEIPYSVVYLENYKVIAVAYHSNEIKFFGLLTGKLERTFDLSRNDEYRMFLVKDKNMIGVTSENTNLIKFIQLSPEGS